MIQLTDKTQCCGCTACYSICPSHAIRMVPDTMGFIYPEVDLTKCVSCGLCDKVCAFNDSYSKSFNIPEIEAYAFRHKDLNQVNTSRSGAAFISISDWIIENGGVIYGAGYTEGFRVIHKRAETKEQRDEFKGSKYVQSDLNSVFLMIKEDLDKGRLVMFSGTPCQTAGLASFIAPQKRDRLYLVDIVCHGVPAPSIWKDYIHYIEKKYKSKIISVNFRDKSELGWTAHKESFLFESGKIYRKTYTDLFYKHIILRPSCKVCHFANIVRPSDLTLADFWGWQKWNPSLNIDDKGISLVLCNTEKGKQLFVDISSTAESEKVNISMCLQPNLQHPSVFSTKYLQFEKDYKRYGFKYVVMKYGDFGYKDPIVNFIGRVKKITKVLFNR